MGGTYHVAIIKDIDPRRNDFKQFRIDWNSVFVFHSVNLVGSGMREQGKKRSEDEEVRSEFL